MTKKVRRLTINLYVPKSGPFVYFTKITAAIWFINKIIPVSIALVELFCGRTLVDLELLVVLFFAIVD